MGMVLLARWAADPWAKGCPPRFALPTMCRAAHHVSRCPPCVALPTMCRAAHHVSRCPPHVLQASTHDKYWTGLLARSSSLARTSSLSSSGGPIGPIKAAPLLVLPDAKQAKLFDSDVMQNSGGLQTVVVSGWGQERPGDLLLQEERGRVKHAYALVGHSHGFAVSAGKVTYPSAHEPTRIAIRLELEGRHESVRLGLGAMDGGFAKNASHVKLYELPAPPAITLRILSRHLIAEVCSKTRPDLTPLDLT
jgi:hypothetical protein